MKKKLFIKVSNQFRDKAWQFAKEIIDRIDNAEIEIARNVSDLYDTISEDCYTWPWDEDKWTIIAEYSDPANPISWDQACYQFIDDLINNIEIVEVEDEDDE